MVSHTFASTDDVTAVLDGIRRIVRVLRLGAAGAERQLGLSGAQLFVLQKLAEAPDPISMNDLAARTHTHQSSVSVVVQRLVDRRLVARSRSDLDGRRLELSITAAGRRLLAKAPAAAQDRLIAAINSLPAEQRQSLARLLTCVTTAAGMSDEPVGMFFEANDERRTRNEERRMRKVSPPRTRSRK